MEMDMLNVLNYNLTTVHCHTFINILLEYDDDSSSTILKDFASNILLLRMILKFLSSQVASAIIYIYSAIIQLFHILSIFNYFIFHFHFSLYLTISFSISFIHFFHSTILFNDIIQFFTQLLLNYIIQRYYSIFHSIVNFLFNYITQFLHNYIVNFLFNFLFNLFSHGALIII